MSFFPACRSAFSILLPLLLLASALVADSTSASRTDQARRLFLQDQYTPALNHLAQGPADVDGLLLESQIYGAFMQYERAHAVLNEVIRLHPDHVEALQRRAELARDEAIMNGRTPDQAGVRADFEKALSLAPEQGTTLLSYAAHLFLVGDRELGEATYRRAQGQRPFADREMGLNEAMILLIKGQTRDANRVLADYEKRFGHDSQSLLAQGLVLMNEGRSELGGTYLERSFQQNPEHLVGLTAIFSSLISAGMQDRARSILSVAEGQQLSPTILAGLRSRLPNVAVGSPTLPMSAGSSEMASPLSGEVRRGRLVYEGLTADDVAQGALNPIHREFAGALDEIGGLLDHTPAEVRVRLQADAGLQYPGYYDPDSDTITVAVEWFRYDDPPANAGLNGNQLRQLTAHVVRHELSHLVLAHKVGLDTYRRKAGALPLWLLEGFAEWAAGGAHNACRTPQEVKGFFASGLLDYQTMQGAMQVTGQPKDRELNHKAYVQSFFTCQYLIGRSEGRAGVARFMEFFGDLMQSDGQLTGALARRYGLSEEDFFRGWTTLLVQDVLQTPQPRLDSLRPPRPEKAD